MREETYRLCKTILLAIFVVGSLVIGHQFSQNGRYRQYDVRKEYSPSGTEHRTSPGEMYFDTRIGRSH